MQLKRWPKAILSQVRAQHAGWQRFPLIVLTSPYLFAALLSTAALFVRTALGPVFQELHPFLLSYAAVALVSLRWGLGPAVLASVLGFLGSDYFLLSPRYAFHLAPEMIASAIAYFALCAIVVALGEANHRSRERLRHNDWQFRRFLESNIMPIIRGRADHIIEANDIFLKMTGFSREELRTGRLHWRDFTPAEYFSKDEAALEQLQQQGFCDRFEKEYIRKDGTRVPVLIGATALSLAPLEWLCFVVDLSDLKQAEAELHTMHNELEKRIASRTEDLLLTLSRLQAEVDGRKKTEEQLRELSASLLHLQDEERRRVARELHDSTGQTLTALKMELARFARCITSAPDSASVMASVEALADQALREIRTLSHLLHPPLLDEVGFNSAAEWYVTGFAQRSGIKVNLELTAIPRIAREVELSLFRVLQESLTNVLRHSGSSEVNVRLCLDADKICLSVKDNGRGIEQEILAKFRQTGAGLGVGIAGMRQRLEQLGGRLELQSNGTGTFVAAILPVPKTADSDLHENASAESRAA